MAVLPPWLRLPVLAREPFAEWSRCHLGLVRPGQISGAVLPAARV
nr:hypothetical protein [Klebsiella quasipneumoniae]